MGDLPRQEYHQASTDGYYIVLRTFFQVHAQLTTLLRQPGIVEVDHRRHHAPVVVTEPVDMLEVESARRVHREMTLKVLQPQEQATVERLAQAVHQRQIAVADLGLAGLDPLDMIAANPLANLRRRPSTHGSRGQLTFGRTFTALSRQGSGQILRQENILLRPTVGSQVVDDL